MMLLNLQEPSLAHKQCHMVMYYWHIKALCMVSLAWRTHDAAKQHLISLRWCLIRRTCWLGNASKCSPDQTQISHEPLQAREAAPGASPGTRTVFLEYSTSRSPVPEGLALCSRLSHLPCRDASFLTAVTAKFDLSHLFLQLLILWQQGRPTTLWMGRFLPSPCSTYMPTSGKAPVQCVHPGLHGATRRMEPTWHVCPNHSPLPQSGGCFPG